MNQQVTATSRRCTGSLVVSRAVSRCALFLFTAIAACSSQPSATPARGSGTRPIAAPAPAIGEDAGERGAPAPAERRERGGATATQAPAGTPPVPPAEAGDDFAAQVTALYRVGACGNDAAIPAQLPKKTVDRHCAGMRRRYASYRRAWADQAGAFMAALRPAGLPTTVVYPFGGGDLVSALVVFPTATEITTISLEAAGDVRTIDGIDRRQLAHDLDVIGHDIGRLHHAAHSTTESLQTASHSRLPGTILFALAALAVHGQEPLSLRYFDLEADGRPRYLSGAELDDRVRAVVAAVDAKDPRPKRRKKLGKGQVHHAWREQESVFANIEIRFRPQADPAAPVRIYRHIVANLDDEHVGADRRVVAHLEAKGKVSVITKAASFLLWYDDFSHIRTYLMSNLAWMVSDASGIPPSYAAKAGLEQVTYGAFVGPYFIKDPNNVRREMIKLWRTNPQRDLPFRFGYPDAEKNHHLMVTRPRT